MASYINELLIAMIGIIITTVVTFLANTFNNFIKNKNFQLQTASKLNTLSNIIFDSVRATQQIYVSSLKDNNIFDVEHQKKALNHAKDFILKNLTEDMLSFIKTLTPSINSFLEMKIESAIEVIKNNNKE